MMKSALYRFLFTFRLFQLYVDDPNGGGGDPTPKPAAKPEPETFSREYVTELRQENASYRTKGAEAAKRAEDAEAAAKRAQQEADEKVANAGKAANERIIRAELKAVAVKAGMVDLDGLKLADLSKVTLDDQGEVQGAAELMEALKAEKPYLFGATSNSSTPEKTPKPKPAETKKATEMDDKEYAAAKKALVSGK